MNLKQKAIELDAKDPLGEYPSKFFVADSEVCYLDGNSLGRLPLATLDRINNFMASEWGSQIVGGWENWISAATSVGDLVGRSALGAKPGQVLITDSTTVNLYQLTVATIKSNSGRTKIITDAANFPTDRYVLQGIAEQFGLELVVIPNGQIENENSELVTPEVLKPYLDETVALVVLQVVSYRSGSRQDVKAITSLVRDFGAFCIWDAAHAIGSVDLRFDEWGVDLAIGCTYKYGNSGPGAPGWLYVAERLQSQLYPPIQGWFAQSNQFDMGAEFSKAEGIRGFMVGTPTIMALAAIESSFEMIAEAGIKEIANKATAGTEFMIEIYREMLNSLGFGMATPSEPTLRGGHIALTHPEAERIAVAMRTKIKVIPDFRAPNVIRIAMSPLTNTYLEIYTGLERLAQMVREKAFEDISLGENYVR